MRMHLGIAAPLELLSRLIVLLPWFVTHTTSLASTAMADGALKLALYPVPESTVPPWLYSVTVLRGKLFFEKPRKTYMRGQTLMSATAC
jgi:hypothetical protein